MTGRGSFAELLLVKPAREGAPVDPRNAVVSSQTTRTTAEMKGKMFCYEVVRVTKH